MLIHAEKGIDKEAMKRLEKYLPKELPYGKILGKVKLVDCIKMSTEFKEMLSNERMLDTGGSLLCLLNDDHTLIFQDGNKMFTVDGIPAMLDGACMKMEDEKYSIPMTSLTFIFGYGSIGTSVNGDDLIYTMAQ